MHRDLGQKLGGFVGCLMLLWLSVGFAGCRSKDTCEGSCLHGVCNRGTCECDTGYTGTQCDAEERAQFLGGLWYNNRSCVGGTVLLISRIEAASDDIRNLLLYNVHNDPDTVRGSVRGDTLFVPIQVHGFDYIQGQGFASGGGVTLDYKIITTTGVETPCIAQFSR